MNVKQTHTKITKQNKNVHLVEPPAQKKMMQNRIRNSIENSCVNVNMQ